MVDLAGNPTLGSGNVANGTYPCVIIEISDTFTYIPEATDGACTEGDEFSRGVCDADPLLFIDGSSGACTEGEDRVALYLSTANTLVTPEDWIEAGCDSAGVDCNSFVPPTESVTTRGVALGAALVVSGDQSGTFVVDLTDGLQEIINGDGGATCSIENIRFGFE